MLQKFKIISYVLFGIISIQASAYASVTDSKIDFSLFIEKPESNKLIKKSPQESLRKAYKNMLDRYHFEKFEEKLEKFKESIFIPIKFPPDTDQSEFLKEARNLKAKLEKSSFKPHFSSALAVLDYRIDNARIDQQLVRNQACLRLKHVDFSLSIQNALNEIIGRIFHITLTLHKDGDVEDVTDVGSAILVSLDPISNLPINLEKGKSLNGIMTCAHVIAAPEDERIIGAYFVPNSYLDSETGFPFSKDVTNEHSLKDYLRTSSESYTLQTYFTKKRNGEKFTLSNAHDILSTNPQYRRNEDIVFVTFNNQPIIYNWDVKFDFSNFSTQTQPSNKFLQNEKYYAIGYPTCSHYSDVNFKNHPHKELIKSIGFAPLFVTSAITQDSDYSILNNGYIKHSAPTAKGMSGGGLFKIEKANDTEIIYIIGSIASGDNDNEVCCY